MRRDHLGRRGGEVFGGEAAVVADDHPAIRTAAPHHPLGDRLSAYANGVERVFVGYACTPAVGPEDYVQRVPGAGGQSPPSSWPAGLLMAALQ